MLFESTPSVRYIIIMTVILKVQWTVLPLEIMWGQGRSREMDNSGRCIVHCAHCLKFFFLMMMGAESGRGTGDSPPAFCMADDPCS